jgi:capsular polysaccharide biosynthesis protein
VLPKLRWLEEYETATGTSPTLLVNADLQSHHERSLQLMGYDPESWVETGTDPIRVRELVVAPHARRARGTHLHTSPLEWVADRIQSNLDLGGEDFPDRVYISRRDADRRHVHNESEVVEALGEEGFEWYEPGRLEYEDEIRLFAGADIVVGAHGKGLASVFHADDAALVELFPKRGATEHYFLTARELGLSYECLSCDPVEDGSNLRPRDRDIVVDVDGLRARIDAVEEAVSDPVDTGHSPNV